MASQDDSDDCLDDPIQLIDGEHYKFQDLQLMEGDPCKSIDLTVSDDEDVVEVSPQMPQTRIASSVPVTSISVFRNVKLLSDCRPFSIKIVDCGKYTWFFKVKRHDTTSCDGNIGNTKDTKLTAKESQIVYDTMTEAKAKPKIRPVATPYKMLKVDYKSTEVIKTLRDTNKSDDNGNQYVLNQKKTDVFAHIDFKRNRGLKGLNITQMNKMYAILKIQTEKTVTEKQALNKELPDKVLKSCFENTETTKLENSINTIAQKGCDQKPNFVNGVDTIKPESRDSIKIARNKEDTEKSTFAPVLKQKSKNAIRLVFESQKDNTQSMPRLPVTSDESKLKSNTAKRTQKNAECIEKLAKPCIDNVPKLLKSQKDSILSVPLLPVTTEESYSKSNTKSIAKTIKPIVLKISKPNAENEKKKFKPNTENISIERDAKTLKPNPESETNIKKPSTESIARSLVSIAEFTKGEKKIPAPKPRTKTKAKNTKKDNSGLKGKKKKKDTSGDTPKIKKKTKTKTIPNASITLNTDLFEQNMNTGWPGQNITISYNMETQTWIKSINTDSKLAYENILKNGKTKQNCTSKQTNVKKTRKGNNKKPEAKKIVDPKKVKLMANKTLVMTDNENNNKNYEMTNNHIGVTNNSDFLVKASNLPSEQLGQSQTFANSQSVVSSFFVKNQPCEKGSMMQQNATKSSTTQVLTHQGNFTVCPYTLSSQTPPTYSDMRSHCMGEGTSTVPCTVVDNEGVKATTVPITAQPLYQNDNGVIFKIPYYNDQKIRNLPNPLPESTTRNNTSFNKKNELLIRHLERTNIINTSSKADCNTMPSSVGARGHIVNLGPALGMMQQPKYGQQQCSSTELNNLENAVNKLPVPYDYSMPYLTSVGSLNPSLNYQKNNQACPIETVVRNREDIYNRRNIPQQKLQPYVTESPQYQVQPFNRQSNISYMRCSPIYDRMPQNISPEDYYWRWQYPHFAPPPPPLPPSSQQTQNYKSPNLTTVIPNENIDNSSIIGQNISGPIRKININAVSTASINNSKLSDFSYDPKSTIVNPVAVPHITSKTEMLEELRKGDFESPAHSPVKDDLKRPLPINDVSLKLNTQLNLDTLSKKPKLDTASQKQTQQGSVNGYSPPILPIPTYEKSLEMLAKANQVDARKAVGQETLEELRKFRKPDSKIEQRQSFLDSNQDTSVKKISLHEYKKRVDGSEENNKEESKLIEQNKTPSMEIKSENQDSDLGYDSDYTFKL